MTTLFSGGFKRRKLGWALLFLALVVVAGAPYAIWFFRHTGPEAEAARLMELMQLGPALTVAEIGAGKGEITVSVARRAGPAGHVFSTELDAVRLSDIREAVSRAALGNVTVIQGGERETNLPGQCCEAIFMRDVYHHFTNPAAMNVSLLQNLRPGGVLAVIDFAPRHWLFWLRRPSGVPENRGGHGIPQKILVQEMTHAGFLLDRAIDGWGYWPEASYCIVFRKPQPQASRAADSSVSGSHHESADRMLSSLPTKRPFDNRYEPDLTSTVSASVLPAGRRPSRRRVVAQPSCSCDGIGPSHLQAMAARL